MKKIYTSISFILFALFVSVNGYATMVVTAVITDPTCDGANNGSATVTVAGGVAPYTYADINGNFQSSNVITSIPEGTFYIFVMDANGDISDPLAITIGAGPTLTASVLITKPSCVGGLNGSISITPTSGMAPYTYYLNGYGNIPNFTSGDPYTFGGLQVGTYFPVLQDGHGCIAYFDGVMNDGDSALRLVLTNIVKASCLGAEDTRATIDFFNGVAPYTLQGGSGFGLNVSTSGGPNDWIGFNDQGTITGVYLTDSEGCQSVIDIVIPFADPAYTHAGNDTILCSNSSVYLVGEAPDFYQGGTIYEWSPSAGLSDSTVPYPLATPAVTTTYTLTTRANWSIPTCVTSDEITIVVVNPETPVIVADGATLSVSNPVNGTIYTWQQLNGGTWEDVFPAATGTSYTTISSDQHRVKAFNGFCESYSSPVGASRAAPANSFGIYTYPNPTTAILRIEELKLSDGWQTLEIINAQGRHSLPVTNITNQTQVAVNVATLNSGIYIIRLRGGNGKTTSIRFIKQ